MEPLPLSMAKLSLILYFSFKNLFVKRLPPPLGPPTGSFRWGDLECSLPDSERRGVGVGVSKDVSNSDVCRNSAENAIGGESEPNSIS